MSKTDPKQLYDELADRIKEFHSIKMLPIPLNIPSNVVKLEDGLDLGQSLFTNSAKFTKVANWSLPQILKASSNTPKTNTETSREERSAGIICWFNYHYKAGIGFHLSCILWLTYYHNIFDKCKAVVIN